jgi:hypothetical protein
MSLGSEGPALHPYSTTTRQRARSTRSPGNKAACSGASRKPPSSEQWQTSERALLPHLPLISRWVLLPLRTDRVSLTSAALSFFTLPSSNSPPRQRVDTRTTKDAGPQLGAPLAEERGRIGHTARWRLSSSFAPVVDPGVETSVTDLYVRTLQSRSQIWLCWESSSCTANADASRASCLDSFPT